MKERKKDNMTNWFVLTIKNGPIEDASSANLPNETTIDGLKDYLKKDVDAPLLKVYEKDEERGMHALAPGAKIEHRGETEAKALVVVVSVFQEPVNIPMTSLKDAFEQLRIAKEENIPMTSLNHDKILEEIGSMAKWKAGTIHGFPTLVNS
jgi:hypothetical protein